MDGWYLDDKGDQSFFSSFNSSSCSSSLGLTHDEVLAACLELEDSSFIDQFYQASGYTGWDGRETEFEISTLSDIDMNMGARHQTSMQAWRKDEIQQFVPTSDDLALTRAMAAIISSSSSSSSPSSSSLSLLYQPPQQVQTDVQSKVYGGQIGAFMPCNPSLVPDFEPKKSLFSQNMNGGRIGAFTPYYPSPAPNFESEKDLFGQKMMKASFSMLTKMDQYTREEGQHKETQSNCIQMQHIVSERKRREKLNDSFHTLRSLLPPGSKKDKASVLTNTRRYLSTLKANNSKLEEDNTKLEIHMLDAHEADDADGSIEKVKVRIKKGVKSRTGGLQQIEVHIFIRVSCDVVELVLQILECLKDMRFARLMCFDVNRINLFVQAILKLHIKDDNWDEEWFMEAMSRVVDRVVMT